MEVRILQRQGETHNQETLKEATHFILNELVDSSLLVDVTIKLVLCHSKYYGETFSCDKTGVATIKLSRDYDLLTMLVTLAHELVHVKQWLVRDLTESSTGNTWYWKGTTIRHSTIEKMPIDEYNDMPWEVEAYDQQLTLAQKFVNQRLIKIDALQ